MPFSLIAAVVSHFPGWKAVAVKQPCVVNSERPNARRFVHGGGGGGLGTSAGRGPRFRVRVTMSSCTGVALSRIRTLTTWGPSTVYVGVTELVPVPSSKDPSSSVSHS